MTDPECPSCHKTDVVQIIYGYPDEETLIDAEAGRIVLGGCYVSPTNPTHHCRVCGYRFVTVRHEE